MTETKGEYPGSTVAIFGIGVAAVLVGGACNVFLRTSFVGGLGGLVAIIGVVLIIVSIFRGLSDRQRSRKLADTASRSVIANTAPSGSVAGEVDRLAALHRKGTLSDDEFAAAKAKVLKRD